MLAARVCNAFESLGVSAAVITSASAVAILAVIVYPPPGHPCPKRKIVTVRRCVIRRLCRDRPVSIGIGEAAARVIFRLDRDHCRVAGKMRSFGLDLCRHFKLWPAKLLYLE